MASERGWNAPFRSGARSALVFPLRLSEKGAGTVSGIVDSAWELPPQEQKVEAAVCTLLL